MIVQSTDIEFPADAADAVIAGVRDGVIPATEKYDGFRAGIWGVDRRTFRIVNLNVWASDSALATARADTVQTLGGTLYDHGIVDLGHQRYELAGSTRGTADGDTGVIQALRTEYSAERENDVLTALRAEVIPLTSGLDGFIAGIWGVDHRTHTITNFNAWESDQAPVQARAKLAKTVGNSVHDRTGAVDAALQRYELIGIAWSDS